MNEIRYYSKKIIDFSLLLSTHGSMVNSVLFFFPIKKI
jgi:hypothetical protein